LEAFVKTKNISKNLGLILITNHLLVLVVKIFLRVIPVGLRVIWLVIQNAIISTWTNEKKYRAAITKTKQMALIKNIFDVGFREIGKNLLINRRLGLHLYKAI
jgi:hypothetical protein